MAEAFFLSGLASNACVQAQGVTVSSEDPLFPKANLQNGRPWEPFRFGSLSANPTIDFDCNIVPNSSFELDADGTSPPSFYSIPTGGGSPDVSTAVTPPNGTRSLRLNLANEAAFIDRIVRPGGTYRHTVQLRGDGTNIVSAYVQDLISGKWLLSNQTWSTTKTAWATRSPATFALSSITFTMEAPVPGHVGPGIVRLLYDRPGTITAAAYVDEVYLWPQLTMAALLFDTIPSAFSVAVQTDDNAAFSSPTARGTLPAHRYRRFVIFNGLATPERYLRFAITGTPFDLYRLWIGQPVAGERRTITRNPARDFTTSRLMPQGGTDEIPATEADAPRYGLNLRWRDSSAGLDVALNEMLAACRYGAEPLLIAPRDDRGQAFVYGRGRSLAEVSYVEIAEGVFERELSVMDDRYPVLTK